MNNQTKSTSLPEKSDNAKLAENTSNEQRVSEANDSIYDYVPISKLDIGTYKQIFFIDSIFHREDMKTKFGKPFAKLTLKDTTGTISGNVWNWTNNIKPGTYVLMEIDVDIYEKELNFTCNYIRTVNEPLNVHDYMQSIDKTTLDSYIVNIRNIIREMKDEDYRNILNCAVDSLDLMNIFSQSPYGLLGPLACRGGLAVCIGQMLRIAKPIEPTLDLVITGCILRNIGWNTTTYFNGNLLRTKDAFHMTGISRASMRFIDHLIMHTESAMGIKIPETKKQALENLCNPIQEIKTLEGRMVANINELLDTMIFGGAEITGRDSGNWNGKFFIGHNKCKN